MSDLGFDDADADLNHFNRIFPDFNSDRECSYLTCSAFNDQFKTVNIDNLSVIHINIRSLSANGDTFVSNLLTLNLNFDVICFSETWLNFEHSLGNFLPSYNGFHACRPSGRRSGGVAIYVSKRLTASEYTDLTCIADCIECIFIKIKSNNIEN